MNTEALLLSLQLATTVSLLLLAFALPLDAEFKQSLLAELHVEARLRTLHDFLEGVKPSQRRFPPEFSVN